MRRLGEWCRSPGASHTARKSTALSWHLPCLHYYSSTPAWNRWHCSPRDCCRWDNKLKFPSRHALPFSTSCKFISAAFPARLIDALDYFRICYYQHIALRSAIILTCFFLLSSLKISFHTLWILMRGVFVKPLKLNSLWRSIKDARVPLHINSPSISINSYSLLLQQIFIVSSTN